MVAPNRTGAVTGHNPVRSSMRKLLLLLVLLAPPAFAQTPEAVQLTAPGAIKAPVAQTIATGGTPQQLFPATDANRHIMIQNLSNEVLCFSKLSVTPSCGTAGTYILKAETSAGDGTGGSYSTPPGQNDNTAIWIVAATSTHPFAAEAQ